jgi:poly-gamma-glutamate system protein
MSDVVRPRVGRFAPGRRQLAAAGWVLAAAWMAAGWHAGAPNAGAWRPGWLRQPAAGIGQRAAAAERTMVRAEDLIYAAKQAAAVAPVPGAGVDRSGLVGDELTPLVTTLGSLEAKRASTNPAWAHALTERMAEAGVGPGDLVAAGFSGSFPALNIAVMSACDALGARVVAVSSVTASTWGANQPGFTWPQIEARLVRARILPRASIAVTAGGETDRVADLPEEARALARAALGDAAAQLGVPVLSPTDYHDAVRQRLARYRLAARGRPIALYVNVGGASASLGRSSAILRFESGFIRAGRLDRSDERGVTARLAEDGVRVLMLLNIRDLAVRWGVPITGRAF